MTLRTLFIGCLFLLNQAFAQSSVPLITKDSVDIFQEGADEKISEQYAPGHRTQQAYDPGSIYLCAGYSPCRRNNCQDFSEQGWAYP